MATYHICDLCGEDLKDGPTYFIAVGPSISVKKPIDKDIDEVRNSSFFERIEPHSNKEVCKDCATAYSRSLDKADELRDVRQKALIVGSIDYGQYNGEGTMVIENGKAFAFGRYDY